MLQNLKMIPCPKCQEDYPELRKTKYGYNFCVNCSTVESVVGITTVEGTGDHTYNDLIIMDAGKARLLALKDAELRGDKQATLEINSTYENDPEHSELAVSQSVKETLITILDSESEVQSQVDDTQHGISGIDY
jgi:hypothetical protein|tara:strand:+ start:1643 stop:2044 length:402 start_codon:yes stop_codon:yes gene_type:complete